MNKDQSRLVELLSGELEQGNLAIFAGAGFSRPAGFVDWKELLRPIADDLDLDVEKEWDLVTLAQYHANANGANRAKLNQLLVTEFSKNATPTENHHILSRIPINTFWTTNYDRLIETSLFQNGKIVDVKYTIKQLATNKPYRDAAVYKMHGDSEHPSEAVLIRDDYERYHVKMSPFITALSGDLISKTFLFLGFSFTDPNLEYILSRVRIQYGHDQRQHHCLLRKVQLEKGEERADFEYRERKQKLFVSELLRVGIKVTYIDDYEEITHILQAIEYRYKSRTVFISGAAHDYGPWGRDKSEQFVYRLSAAISKRHFRVVTGFGLGIGSAVVSGVIEQTVMSGGRLDSNKLMFRPFPQTQSGETPLKELWHEYRKDMLNHAGVAIFLFGNKLENDEIVESNGMRDEFAIAKEKGIFVIPIGVTGYVARSLWNEVTTAFVPKNFLNGDQIVPLLKALGDDSTDLDKAFDLTLEILNLI